MSRHWLSRTRSANASDVEEDKPRRRREDIVLGQAPCPWCGYSLVARMNAHGPYFYCLCGEAPESRAQAATASPHDHPVGEDAKLRWEELWSKETVA